MDWDLIQRLMNCFPNSFINHNGEFIAHRKANVYFILKDCRNELDVKCKVLEWLSRAAHKTCSYGSDRKNKEFQKFMLNGVNQFLGTSFSEDDIEVIYTYLGNACNHKKTVSFICSGYDMNILKGE